MDKANHFKDVKIYYFHNCIYSNLYKTPECDYGDWVDTEWVFRNLDSEYRVIIVGDAQMGREELMSVVGNYRAGNGGLRALTGCGCSGALQADRLAQPRKHDNVKAAVAGERIPGSPAVSHV